jgi:hypothetical protein
LRPEIGLKKHEVKKIIRTLRSLCLTLAILMILSVTVHPALAQMDAKDRIDKTNAAIEQIREAGVACPECSAGISPETSGRFLNQSNLSVKIREVDLDSGFAGPTIAGATKINLSMGTLEVRPEGSLNSLSTTADDRSAEIIADFDNDPEVRAYIHNVTADWGYTERTGVFVQRMAANFTGRNVSLNGGESGALFDVLTYEYTNTTTKYRYKFWATQAVAENGTAIPPKFVLPGGEFPPGTSIKDPDAECWYWYLLIGLAVLAVIAAIVVTIGIMIASGQIVSTYNKKFKNYESPSPKLFESKKHPILEEFLPSREMYTPELDPEHQFWSNKWAEQAQSFTTQQPNWISRHSANMLYLIFLVLLIIIGIAFPLVSLALDGLVACIIGLHICKQLVKDENDRARLEEMLNPESWVGITERDNGQPIYVSSARGNQIMVALEEGNESGVPYVWNATADIPIHSVNFQLSYVEAPDTHVRVWMFLAPENHAMNFSARYVPADAPEGPGIRQFTVRILPMRWSPPVDVDNSSKWVGYGTSLALDPKTDRMHISYLDYAGTWDGAGKLIYRSGIGTAWDPPVIVDDSISWTTREGTEMARYTSIELDPDGNPQISYMDWRNGHLKFARKIAAGDKDTTQDRWQVETVDGSSSYAGWGSSLAVDRQGNPHISYLRQAGFGDAPELRYAHWNGTDWDKQTLATIAGKDDAGKFWNENVNPGAITSIALDSAGRPHISYVDYNRDPGKEETCHLSGTDKAPFSLCSENLQLMHTAWNGEAWITEPVDQTYWDDDFDQVRYVNVLDPNTVLYTRHGLYSSLEIDAQDHPHISYFSIRNKLCVNFDIALPGSPLCDAQWIGNLKYASHDGSAWTTEVADDSTNSVGLYSSLKIDRYGNPHISYMDWKNGFLRYATRSGGSHWLKSIPDRQNSDTGRFSSLALDAQGLPRIVYMDYRNGHVKYVFGSFPGEKTSALLSAGPLAGPVGDGTEMIELLPFP